LPLIGHLTTNNPSKIRRINPPLSNFLGGLKTRRFRSPLVSGEVAYQEEPGGVPDDGEVLICISQPKTKKIVLDI
jgi:hypothetical protein